MRVRVTAALLAVLLRVQRELEPRPADDLVRVRARVRVT